MVAHVREGFTRLCRVERHEEHDRERAARLCQSKCGHGLWQGLTSGRPYRFSTTNSLCDGQAQHSLEKQRDCGSNVAPPLDTLDSSSESVLTQLVGPARSIASRSG